MANFPLFILIFNFFMTIGLGIQVLFLHQKINEERLNTEKLLNELLIELQRVRSEQQAQQIIYHTTGLNPWLVSIGFGLLAVGGLVLSWYFFNVIQEQGKVIDALQTKVDLLSETSLKDSVELHNYVEQVAAGWGTEMLNIGIAIDQLHQGISSVVKTVFSNHPISRVEALSRIACEQDEVIATMHDAILKIDPSAKLNDLLDPQMFDALSSAPKQVGFAFFFIFALSSVPFHLVFKHNVSLSHNFSTNTRLIGEKNYIELHVDLNNFSNYDKHAMENKSELDCVRALYINEPETLHVQINKVLNFITLQYSRTFKIKCQYYWIDFSRNRMPVCLGMAEDVWPTFEKKACIYTIFELAKQFSNTFMNPRQREYWKPKKHPPKIPLLPPKIRDKIIYIVCFISANDFDMLLQERHGIKIKKEKTSLIIKK